MGEGEQSRVIQGDPIRVVIFEDDQQWIEIARKELEALGCLVLAVIESFSKAEEIIPSLAQLGVQYALVDGNLSPHASDGFEGRSVQALIKKMAPQVKTIGFSAMDQDYVDYPLGKGAFRAKLKAILDGETR